MSKWNDFNVEETKKEKTLCVPVQRANRGSPCLVFNKPNKWGPSIKVAIRQIAKRLPEYHLPIKNEFLPMTVEQDGKEIKVNTLGRWAFGVPGYAGHLVFEGFNFDQIVIYYPKGSPKELLELLEKAIKSLK